MLRLVFVGCCLLSVVPRLMVVGCCCLCVAFCVLCGVCCLACVVCCLVVSVGVSCCVLFDVCRVVVAMLFGDCRVMFGVFRLRFVGLLVVGFLFVVWCCLDGC